jgi:DNA-binding protein HU-beta
MGSGMAPRSTDRNMGQNRQNCFDFRSESHLTSTVHLAHASRRAIHYGRQSYETNLSGQDQPSRYAQAFLGDLVGLITKHLKKGERIRIAGLGILQVRKRAARMGRNPATGEAIKIKPSKKVAFRAAKELKLAV